MCGRYFPMQIQELWGQKRVSLSLRLGHTYLWTVQYGSWEGMKTGSSARAQSAFISKDIANPQGVVSKANLWVKKCQPHLHYSSLCTMLFCTEAALSLSPICEMFKTINARNVDVHKNLLKGKLCFMDMFFEVHWASSWFFLALNMPIDPN